MSERNTSSSNSRESGSKGRANDGQQNQQNNNTSVTSAHVTIPNEAGNPNCPVCLYRIQQRAYTDSCLHEFCFPCIREWSLNHNQCPICRRRYTNILHNVRSSTEYDELAVAEPPDEPHSGVLITDGRFGIFTTPEDEGIYLVNPRISPHGMRYDLLFLAPGLTFFLQNINPNMILVRPESLGQLTTFLDRLGMLRHHPHNGSHPHFLQYHRHNDRH